MRKLVVTEFMSLDGVMEAPGGEDDFPHGAWTIPFWGDDIGSFKSEELESAEVSAARPDAVRGLRRAWPERGGDPFADKINSMRKFVASTTLTDPTWRTRGHRGRPRRGRAGAEGRGRRRHLMLPGASRSPASCWTPTWSTRSGWRCTRVVLGHGAAPVRRGRLAPPGARRGRPAGDSGAVLLVYRRSDVPLGKPSFGTEDNEEFPYDE